MTKACIKTFIRIILLLSLTACGADTVPPDKTVSILSAASTDGEEESSSLPVSDFRPLKEYLSFTIDDVDYLVFERQQFDETVATVRNRNKINESVQIISNVQAKKESRMGSGSNGSWVHEEYCNIILKDGSAYRFHSFPDYIQKDHDDPQYYTFQDFYDEAPYRQLYGNGKDLPDNDIQGNAFAYLPFVPVLTATVGGEDVPTHLYAYDYDENERATNGIPIPPSAYQAFKAPVGMKGICNISYSAQDLAYEPLEVNATAYYDKDFFISPDIPKEHQYDIRASGLREYKLKNAQQIPVADKTLQLPSGLHGAYFVEITARFERGWVTYFLSYECGD